MDVLLIDDHPMIHEVMREVVRSALPEAHFHAEKDLESGLALARVLPELRLALIDLGLPGYSEIEALVAFRKAFPVIPAVVISALEDSRSVQAALNAGAAGYIPKTSIPAVMIGALKLIASGGIYLPPQAIPPVTKKKSGKANVPAFTDRQADVLRLLMKGLSNRAISRQLRISEHTVKQHVHAAFRALGVASRTEAFVALTRLGLNLD